VMTTSRGCRYLVPLMSAVILLAAASGLRATTAFFDDFSLTTNPWGDFDIQGIPTGLDTIIKTGGLPPPLAGSPYRQTSMSFISPGVAFKAHVAFFSSYVPATQGPIASISFSFEGNELAPAAQGAVGYALLISQNGTYYQGPTHNVAVNSWTPFHDSGLTAASFTKVGTGPGPAQPDFSCAGPAIQFGYMTSASSTANNGNNVMKTSGIDNWCVVITSSAPCCTLTASMLSTSCLGPVPCLDPAEPLNQYSFFASVTYAGAGNCTLAVTSGSTGLHMDFFGPTTFGVGTVFPSGTFAALPTTNPFSLFFTCTTSGGVVCSTRLTTPLPCCNIFCPAGN
jgi:hypothetical protein